MLRAAEGLSKRSMSRLSRNEAHWCAVSSISAIWVRALAAVRIRRPIAGRLLLAAIGVAAIARVLIVGHVGY